MHAIGQAFQYQRIGPEADTMRRLGTSFRAIGAALGVDEQVRKALVARSANPPRLIRHWACDELAADDDDT